MDYLIILLVAIGLCFDTFAVSVSSGIICCNITFRQSLKIAVVLGLFQGGMPVIGWFLGNQVKLIIADFDHWIAFGLLAVIGVKMIIEGIKNEEGKKLDPRKNLVLLGMAVATSIDALVVGLSFAFVDIPIVISAIVIGSVTAIVAMLGILFGKKAGVRFGKKMEILGGIILIGIGAKILIEHLFFT